MGKNIVFDMGEVLIRFEPSLFLARYPLSPEDAALLRREVFRSLEWARLDWGAISEKEAAAAIFKRLPMRLHSVAWELLNRWEEPVLPVEGMSGLLAELKAQGYGLYLLSNASSRLHAYWDKIPGHEFFDGKLVSADLKLVKPQPEIYRALFDAFGLLPEECFFVDDSPLNVEGAFRVGMEGFVFHGDLQPLRGALAERGFLQPRGAR